MFIRVSESENTRNTWRPSFRSGTKLLSTFLSLRFSDMRRERHSFLLCWLFHMTPPRTAPRHKLLVWPRRAPENQLSSSSVESQLTVFFFSNPQILSASLPGFYIPGPISYLGLLLWHLWLSHPPCVRVNTCTQCVHLTNPCTKPKGSQHN